MTLADEEPENLAQPDRQFVVAQCANRVERIGVREKWCNARLKSAESLIIAPFANIDFDRLVTLAGEVRNVELPVPKVVMVQQPLREDVFFVRRKACKGPPAQGTVRGDILGFQDVSY